MKLLVDTFASPVGDLIAAAAADAKSLCLLEFADTRERWQRALQRRFGNAQLVETANPLKIRDRFERYFKEDRDAFKGLALDAGGTAFQQSVWSALRDIPYGETASYKDIAAAIGKPQAYRAVGTANGKNPLAIIVPCHRVIAADGTLGGYGGGLDRKQWLIDHEAN